MTTISASLSSARRRCAGGPTATATLRYSAHFFASAGQTVVATRSGAITSQRVCGVLAIMSSIAVSATAVLPAPTGASTIARSCS